MGNDSSKGDNSSNMDEEGNYNPTTRKERIILFRPHNINNGLQLNNIYLPEEIITHVLSFVDGKDLLHCSLVCCKWYNIVTDGLVWRIKYERELRKKAKNLPWYVYYCYFATSHFDRNLIQNGNGKDEFSGWKLWENSGDKWRIENPPAGAKPLPIKVPELSTSCFATSYQLCSKFQLIDFRKCKLFCSILDSYKPEIYFSEWFTGRFDCSCKYTLEAHLMDGTDKNLSKKSIIRRLEAFTDPDWEKVEIVFKEYNPGVRKIMFFHSGKDSQFWAGHYGSKMAGSVCRINFDSIEPV